MKTIQPFFNLACGYPQLSAPELPGLVAAAFTDTAMSPPQQAVMLERFQHTYFSFAGQHSLAKNKGDTYGIHVAKSATDGIRAALKYLVSRKEIVDIGIINPAPPFLHGLMEMENLHPIRIGEEFLYGQRPFAHDEAEHEKLKDVGALFLTLPNNPSGKYPSEARFASLMKYCKDHGIIVIADFCFRLFAPLEEWDQYDVMRRSGVKFIAIEETGKTFDAGGQKLAFVIAPRHAPKEQNSSLIDLERGGFWHDSADRRMGSTYVRPSQQNLHRDLRTAFKIEGPIASSTIKLVDRVVRADIKASGGMTEQLPVRKAVRANRDALNKHHYWGAAFRDRCGDIPFQQIGGGMFDASAIQKIKALEEMGIATESLAAFYGVKAERHQGLRLALARDPQEFQRFLAAFDVGYETYFERIHRSKAVASGARPR